MQIQSEMGFTITAEQRDALYDHILDRLSGIGDVWTAISKENYEVAERLGQEHSDNLLLVLGDLGWGGEGTGEPVELTAPPDVLRRMFTRLRDHASSHAATVEEEQQEAREMEVRNRLVMEACRGVLDDLDRRQGGNE